jgi:hypothetical protein
VNYRFQFGDQRGVCLPLVRSDTCDERPRAPQPDARARVLLATKRSNGCEFSLDSQGAWSAVDPKQTVTNDSYLAVKATADSGSLRAEI